MACSMMATTTDVSGSHKTLSPVGSSCAGDAEDNIPLKKLLEPESNNAIRALKQTPSAEMRMMSAASRAPSRILVSISEGCARNYVKRVSIELETAYLRAKAELGFPYGNVKSRCPMRVTETIC